MPGVDWAEARRRAERDGRGSDAGLDTRRQAKRVKIAVEIRGRVLSFYIGDELVGTYTATETIAGSLSLGVGSRSSAVFKRLRVERIEEVATPQ